MTCAKQNFIILLDVLFGTCRLIYEGVKDAHVGGKEATDNSP